MKREDGAELYWHSTGEGPAVVICDNVFSIPEALSALEADLVRDHTVVRYDPRGSGRSSRTGPFDLDTDVADLSAILEAADVGPAVAIGPANGVLIATLCATRRPDLVGWVIGPTGVPVATLQLKQGLAASAQVLESIGTQMATDYRGVVRSVTTTGNTQFTEDEARERVEKQVEYCPRETALGRWEAYHHSNTTEEAVELGADEPGPIGIALGHGLLHQRHDLVARLWILLHPNMPWWPVEQAEPLRELLPEAHIEVVEDGPVSRPDILAGVVRGITGVKP